MSETCDVMVRGVSESECGQETVMMGADEEYRPIWYIYFEGPANTCAATRLAQSRASRV